MMPGNWEWFVGCDDDVRLEKRYDIGSYSSREAAIAAGRAAMPCCGSITFHILEAQQSSALKYEGADFVPFIQSRNAEPVDG